MKKIATISIIIIFLFSCESKYPTYLKKEDDVYMKLISFEDSKIKIDNKEFVSVSITITDNDNLLFRQYKEEVIQLKNYNFLFLIKHLNEGDSATFKVPYSKLITMFDPLIIGESNDEFVDVDIKIDKYYTSSEYVSFSKKNDTEMIEQLLLNKYLDEVNVSNLHGIYKVVMDTGHGELVKKGDDIIIGYKGYFINRLKFDDISGSTAFAFKYGTPGQVIKGLEIAIKSMREGEKSKIIIPSQLAFGEEGSTTLIVPSFTTVIYELEILKIKKNR